MHRHPRWWRGQRCSTVRRPTWRHCYQRPPDEGLLALLKASEEASHNVLVSFEPREAAAFSVAVGALGRVRGEMERSLAPQVHQAASVRSHSRRLTAGVDSPHGARSQQSQC
jgi:hypothetical protein